MSISHTFMAKAEAFASVYSDDIDTQVGVCITRGQEELLCACNVLPAGVYSWPPERRTKPLKYSYVMHAEAAAIAEAAKRGIGLAGARMYVTCFPCNSCAQAIIQAGVSRLITKHWDTDMAERYKYDVSLEMFQEAGVEIFYVD